MGLTAPSTINTNTAPMDLDTTNTTTSKKQREFAEEPIGDKCTSHIAGIGPVAAKQLAEHGVTKAYHLLGAFLTLDKDQQKFVDYLRAKTKMTEKNAYRAANTLHEWCINFI